MVLDEPGDNDSVFTEKGITFMVEKKLLERVQPITVDFIDTPRGSGFTIKSNLKKDQDCGSCSC